MSDLGIVIVNYNTREDLGRCLDSIAASSARYTRRVHCGRQRLVGWQCDHGARDVSLGGG